MAHRQSYVSFWVEQITQGRMIHGVVATSFHFGVEHFEFVGNDFGFLGAATQADKTWVKGLRVSGHELWRIALRVDADENDSLSASFPSCCFSAAAPAKAVGQMAGHCVKPKRLRHTCQRNRGATHFALAILQLKSALGFSTGDVDTVIRWWQLVAGSNTQQ